MPRYRSRLQFEQIQLNCSPSHSLIPALRESLDMIGYQPFSHQANVMTIYRDVVYSNTASEVMITTGQNLKRQSLPLCHDFLLDYAANSIAAAFWISIVLLLNFSTGDNYLMVPKISLLCCCYSIARFVLKSSTWSKFILRVTHQGIQFDCLAETCFIAQLCLRKNTSSCHRHMAPLSNRLGIFMENVLAPRADP